MRKLLVFLLVGAMLMGLTACGGSSGSKRPQVQLDTSGREVKYTFRGQTGEALALSEEGSQTVLSVIEQQQPDYFLTELYQLDEVQKRLSFDASVASHKATALDEAGKLTGSHLATLVSSNNEAFLATKPFGYKAVEADYIRQLCDFIVGVVEAMGEKYPDVDWQRVYCNLGNLKILYDTGMLSYAQVNQDMILAISKNNTGALLNIKGEDGFSRVLAHETMHIIQLGCLCEDIENAGRRAGISMYWDDFTLNTTDWTWMVEGAAERHTCSLTGSEAISYQYKMDYLCSLTMSILLRASVAADTMEAMTFYSDPELLFEAFGCSTDAQREELLNMMITLQVLQMQPNSFHIAYTEQTGVDLTEDEEAMDQFSYSLKPAICITLAKEFYENLTVFIRENSPTAQDACFLINLFEGHLNQHLTYKNESKAEVNQPFFDDYNAMRQALFDTLDAENPGLDMTGKYAEYVISSQEGQLNALLKLLPEDKRTFLAERAQWQAELNALGVKVDR